MNAKTFFLAGTMQGSRSGVRMASQDYRSCLAKILKDHVPNATVIDPLVLMTKWFGKDHEQISLEFMKATEAVVFCPAASEAISRVKEKFHRLLKMAADSDVVVACLQGHEASMGTAMEMLKAHQANKAVLTITSMKSNLAILACSDAVLASIEDFEQFVLSDEFNVILNKSQQQASQFLAESQ